MIAVRVTYRNPILWACNMAALLLGSSSPATADVLAVRGKPLTVGVRLVDFVDGQLHVQLPSGRLVKRDIADVRYLRITGWDTFSQAEKLHRDGKFRSAADQYEKLLASLDKESSAGTATDRYDRRLLVQCRLLQAHNALGRFDRAVELYIDIVEEMPACLETLRPKKLPTADSTFLESAVKHIDEAIARHSHDGIGRSLTAWRDTWPGIKPRKPVSKPMPIKPSTHQPIRDELTGIRKMVEARRFDAALDRIQSILTPQAGDSRAELYYWRGRALTGKHVDRNTENAKQDRRRAGLALMRVVIQYPDHSFAPECLYTAGHLCRLAGRHESARRLWSELIGQYPKATPWIDRARDEMTRLQAPASQPAGENRATQPHES